MRKGVLLFALIGFAVGEAPLAGAQDGVPQRGKTYTRDSDLSRFSPKPGASSTEIYILRGTEPKDQSAVTVTDEPAAKKDEGPKTHKVRRGRHTFTVPGE